ncbi:MAG: PEP-CTERM sorting domain-containing protein [Planctomycetota bacterium]
MTTHLCWSCAIALSVLSVTSPSANATLVSATRSSDNVLQGNFESGASNVFLANNPNARRTGTGGAAADTRTNQPVLGFNLPAITPGEFVVGADFSITLDTPGFNGPPTFDVVISLMGGTSFTGADFVEVPGPTGLGAGNAFVGALSPGDTSSGQTETFALTGAALSQLASLYDASGTPSQSEVFFRLSNSETIDISNDQNNNSRFNFARDGAPLRVTRSLTLETSPIPEPSSLLFLAAAGGAAWLGQSRKRMA